MAISIATSVLLAWGLLAFGAVYPWAYWPLVAAAVATGLWGWWIGRSKEGPAKAGHYRTNLTAVATGLLLVTLAGLVQLVPLPRATLTWLSPATPALLEQLSVPFAARAVAAHPFSIDPAATRVALALLVSFGILLLGLTRVLSVIGPRRITAGVVTLGVVAALIAIIQRAFDTYQVYGFWTPIDHTQPFGPFVNRNHFAGWMVMAMGLALGYFGGRLARAMRGVKPTWRERVLWWSSPAASQLLLVATAIIIMGVALVLSLSRSGFTCFLLAIAVTGWTIARRQTTGAHKAAGLAYLALVVILALGWAGVDALARRFAAPPGFAMQGRLGAWDDALGVARNFWLTGTGLNTYGTTMLVYQTHGLEQHFAQAHNDYLQLAAEGGLLVGVPIVAAFALTVRDVRRRFRKRADDTMTYWLRVGAVTGLLAIALQETVDFSLQMPGNAALFVVLMAIAMHRVPAVAGAERARTAALDT